MRGTRLATREIITEPSGECGGLRGRAVHDRRRITLSSGSLSERASGTTVDAIAEFLLRCADLSQQCHGIERAVLLAQSLLHGLGDLRMCQSSLIGRRRIVIALDHLGAFAPLLLQLERWLEKVHVKPCRRVEPGHHAGGLDALESAISHQSSDNRTVLLLDKGLVVLLVGTRSCHLELLPATPGNDHLVHKRTVVVEVDTAQQPREQALSALDRLDDKATVASD